MTAIASAPDDLPDPDDRNALPQSPLTPDRVLPTAPSSDRLGTARFADSDTTVQLHEYEPGKHLFVGRDPLSDLPLGIELADRHALVCAGPRSGKGACIGATQYDWAGSLFTFSTKGDQATSTAERRGPGRPGCCEGMGQEVLVLDPGELAKVPPELRGGFDPLAHINPYLDEGISFVERLAAAIIPFTLKNEQYWDNDGRRMLVALILHVKTHAAFEGKRTLVTVMELANEGDVETWNVLKSGGMLVNESPFDVLTAAMERNEYFQGRIARAGRYYAEMARTASKQWMGVQSNLVTALSFLDKPDMRSLFTAPHRSIAGLKTNPRGMSIFVVLDADRLETDFAFPRLVFTVFLAEMKKHGPPANGSRCLAWLDEFTRLRRLEVLEHSMATIGSYFLNVVVVLQEVGTLKREYQDAWGIFMTACPVQVFMDIGDEFTAKFVSERLGTTERVVQNQSVSFNQSESNQSSYGSSVQETIGQGRSTTESSGTSVNHGGGKGNSSGGGTGQSRGNTFQGSLWNFLIPLHLRENWKGNDGRSLQSNWQGNRNKNWSKGKTTSTGQTVSDNTSHAEGTSETVSFGTTIGWSSSVAEHRERGQLATPQEVTDWFSRTSWPGDPRQPGLMLVVINGYPPIVTRRSFYFSDWLFYWKFGPDGDHEFGHAPKPPYLLEQEERARQLAAEQARKQLEAAEHAEFLRRCASTRLRFFAPCERLSQLGSNVPIRDHVLWRRIDEVDAVAEGDPLLGTQLFPKLLQAPIPGRVVGTTRWIDRSNGERGYEVEFAPDAKQLEAEVQLLRTCGKGVDDAFRSTIDALQHKAAEPLLRLSHGVPEFTSAFERWYGRGQVWFLTIPFGFLGCLSWWFVDEPAAWLLFQGGGFALFALCLTYAVICWGLFSNYYQASKVIQSALADDATLDQAIDALIPDDDNQESEA